MRYVSEGPWVAAIYSEWSVTRCNVTIYLALFPRLYVEKQYWDVLVSDMHTVNKKICSIAHSKMIVAYLQEIFLF